MSFDPCPPDCALLEECEELLRHIAEITDEPMAIVQRRVGYSIEALKAEVDRLDKKQTAGTLVCVCNLSKTSAALFEQINRRRHGITLTQ